MTRDHHSIRNAAALRDAATARIRRTTTAIVAVATCLTAAFTAVAASSTHARRHPATPSRTHQPAARAVKAPAPIVVPIAHSQPRSHSDGPSGTPSSKPTPAPTPAPVASQPVVVSGGS